MTKPSPKEASALLEAAALKVPILASLSSKEIQMVLGAMFEVRATAGETVITEGDKGENFYIVKSGSFAVSHQGKLVRRCGAGQSFGELALLYNAPRNASVKCTQSGVLWALDRASFRIVLTSQKNTEDHAIVSLLGSSPLFASLTQEQLLRLASIVKVLHFESGEYVVRMGELLRIASGCPLSGSKGR